MILSLTLALVLTLSNEFIRCSPTGSFPIFSIVILASDCVLLMSRLTSDSYCLESLLANFTKITEPAKNTSFDPTSQSSIFSLVKTSSKFPNFIKPSVNPIAECNLWGLLCQTGLIEVSVNMTTTITTTTVPCSYYLSAKAESALPGFPTDTFGFPYADYQSHFGRTPQCAAYANYLKKNPAAYIGEWDGRNLDSKARKSEADALTSAFQFSKCGSKSAGDPRLYIPRGVSNSHVELQTAFYCCGRCTLDVREIRLLYFPASTGFRCSTASANTTSQIGPSRLDNGVESLLKNASILITNGNTL